MKKKVLHLIANAHLDPVWFWRWPEGLNESISTCRTILEFMDEFPDLKFSRGESQVYQYLEQMVPQIFIKIRNFVQEGRWEVVGGWFNQPDTNLSFGESLLRQAIIGKEYFRRSLDVEPKVAYLVDSFGQCGGLPQILSRSNLPYLAFVRPRREQLELPHEAFWWKGDADTKILAARIPMGYLTGNDEIPRRIDHVLENWPDGLDDWFCLYGLGNHGGGPSRRQILDILSLRNSYKEVELRFSTLHEFFEKLSGSSQTLPTVQGDLLHHARGCYSANSGIKIQAAQLEKHIFRTQATVAIARTEANAVDPDDAIDSAWKALLNAQFHDTICGTASVECYRDSYDEIGGSIHNLQTIRNHAAVLISQCLDTHGEGQALVVMNLLPWPVRKTIDAEWMLDYRPLENPGMNIYVTDSAGKIVSSQESPTSFVLSSFEWRKKVLFEAELPSMGAKVYRLRYSKVLPECELLINSVEFGDEWLDNGYIKLMISKEKNSCFLVSKTKAEQMVELGVIDVFSDLSDTWGHDQDCFTDYVGSFTIEKVELVERGPLRGVIRVVSHFKKSKFIQTFLLDRGCNYVVCKAELDWHETHAVGKLIFRPAFSCTDSSCTVLRPGAWQMHPTDAGEHPGGRILSLEDDSDNMMTLACPEKPAYDVYKGAIRLTIARSSIYAWYRCEAPSKPDYHQYMDQGVQNFEYQIFVPQSRDTMPETLRAIWQQRYHPHTILTDNHMAEPGLKIDNILNITPATLMPWSFWCDNEAFFCRLWQSSKVLETHDVTYKNNKSTSIAVDAGEIVTLKIYADEDRQQTICERVEIFGRNLSDD